jgi:hypothetical protein
VWLAELFGPALSSPYHPSNEGFGSAGSGYSGYSGGIPLGARGGSGGGNAKAGTGRGGPCLHEDGGRFAIFESTEGDPVCSVKAYCLLWVISEANVAASSVAHHTMHVLFVVSGKIILQQ